jgi:hypothetical protein
MVLRMNLIILEHFELVLQHIDLVLEIISTLYIYKIFFLKHYKNIEYFVNITQFSLKQTIALINEKVCFSWRLEKC